jgi:DNA-binding LacI/PurR family transcriptional regulator
MATIQELSKRCGVSVSTVSKALNGYSDISDRTRELVIKTANEIGYFPNANARALKLKKTYNLGVLFNTFSSLGLKNEYFAHILAAFKDEAAQNGYDITFIEHYVGRRKMTYLEHCQYRHFDGVCIVCADYESEEVIKLVNSDIPVVTIDYAFQKSYSIVSDNYNGMKQLTGFILRQGHTDIAFIHGLGASLVTKNRLEGFYDAMREYGLKVPPEYVAEGAYRNSSVTEEIASKLLQLPKRPTCIISPDDLSAMGVLNAIRKNSLQPVRDVSVAGYDGADVNLLVGAKLTTVKQERESIGKEAARKLIQLIENGESVPLDTIFMRQTLMIGNSVRKLK